MSKLRGVARKAARELKTVDVPTGKYNDAAIREVLCQWMAETIAYDNHRLEKVRAALREEEERLVRIREARAKRQASREEKHQRRMHRRGIVRCEDLCRQHAAVPRRECIVIPPFAPAVPMPEKKTPVRRRDAKIKEPRVNGMLSFEETYQRKSAKFVVRPK